MVDNAERDITRLKTLNHLLEICTEGRRGFEIAAEHIEDDIIKAILTKYAQQRNEFAYELRHIIQELDGVPSDGHNPLATLHRGYMEVKSALTQNEREGILKECLRGEDVAMRQYLSALAEELVEVRPVIWRQYEAIKAAHEEIAQLLEPTYT